MENLERRRDSKECCRTGLYDFSWTCLQTLKCVNKKSFSFFCFAFFLLLSM